MSEKRNVAFSFTCFTIDACHFGRKPKHMPPKREMVSQLIHGFCDWVTKAKHLSDTRIDDDGSEIYVKDVAEGNKCCCVVLWNKMGPGRTTLAVNRVSPPKSKGSIQKKKFDDNFIPGEPLYYLVDAENLCLWTLRPPLAQRTERTALERAFRFYMLAHSKYFDKMVYKANAAEVDHIVKISPSERNIHKGPPRFSATMTRNAQKMEALLSRTDKIQKIVQIVSFENMNQQQRSAFVNYLFKLLSDKLTFKQAQDTKKVKYEIDVKLDKEDVQTIVAEQENKKGNRVGFVAKGMKSPIWADETILRFDQPVSLPFEDDVFSAEDLLAGSMPFLGTHREAVS